MLGKGLFTMHVMSRDKLGPGYGETDLGDPREGNQIQAIWHCDHASEPPMKIRISAGHCGT